MESEIHAEMAAPTATPPAQPATTTAPLAGKAAKKRKKAGRLGKRPVFRIFQVTHRWFSLILGLLLLVIVLSGTALLFKHEIHKVAHPSLFKATDAPAVPMREALLTARRAEPDMKISAIQLSRGMYWAMDDNSKTLLIDAGTGKVNGTMNTQKGVFGFLDNLHECGLTCEGYTGYVPFLAKPINWWIFGEELTWGALILGSIGLLLGFMVISGLVVWWPGIRSMARGFKVRRGNTYKFNYDLHKVIGIVALPFLAVWALTGAGFELPVVKNAWYALLPGSPPAEPPEFESKPIKGQSVTLNQAIAAGEKQLPGGQIVYVGIPDKSEPKSAYDLWASYGNDLYDHGDYPGNRELHVDRYSGAVTTGYGDPKYTTTVAEDLWENWNYPIHAGTPINGWWRIGWLLFGVTPLLLAITGVTTWWIRRGKARRKKRMKAERARAAAPTATA